MSIFDKLSSLANQGREVTVWMNERHLIIRVSDPQRTWSSQREINWRDVMNTAEPDSIFEILLDTMYRDHFRSRREAQRQLNPDNGHGAADGFPGSDYEG